MRRPWFTFFVIVGVLDSLSTGTATGAAFAVIYLALLAFVYWSGI